jgi:predicted nuclease of predicted toxin-antitoxin system
MKILCDVHISFKVSKFLNSLKIEAIHINEILEKWNTKDDDICNYADENNFIVLTKDSDFKNSFLIQNTPNKLIGNISTSQLIEVLQKT